MPGPGLSALPPYSEALVEANFFSVVPNAPMLVCQFLAVNDCAVFPYACGPGLLFPLNSKSFLLELKLAVLALFYLAFMKDRS